MSMLRLTIPGIVNAHDSSGTNGYFTEHFLVAFTGNGIKHMNINILEAIFGGITLDSGDEIASGNPFLPVKKLRTRFCMEKS